MTRVTIIGASVAGSSLAYYLASRGIPVTILDQAKFPRFKACGEGLSRLALPAIEALGLASHFRKIPSLPYFGYRISLDRNQNKNIQISFPEQRGLGVSRLDLDYQIQQAGQEFDTIALHEDTTVQQIDRSAANQWRITTAAGSFQSECLVLADGSRSRGADFCNITTKNPGTKRVAFSMELEQVAQPRHPLVSVFPGKGGEIYCTALPGEFMNVSIVGSAPFVQRELKNDASGTLPEILDNFGASRESVRSACEGAGASHFGVRRSAFDNGVFLIGDACESFDPSCGMGMAHAFISASLAGRAIEQYIMKKLSLLKAGAQYVTAQNRVAARMRQFSALVQHAFSLIGHYPQLGSLVPDKLTMTSFRMLELYLSRQTANLVPVGD